MLGVSSALTTLTAVVPTDDGQRINNWDPNVVPLYSEEHSGFDGDSVSSQRRHLLDGAVQFGPQMMFGQRSNHLSAMCMNLNRAFKYQLRPFSASRRDSSNVVGV